MAPENKRARLLLCFPPLPNQTGRLLAGRISSGKLVLTNPEKKDRIIGYADLPLLLDEVSEAIRNKRRRPDRFRKGE